MDINSMTPDELKAMAAQLQALAKQKQLEAKPEKATRKRKPKKLPKVLKAEQWERFAGAIDPYKQNGVRDRAIIEIMHKAGLRVSEVCALTPADVDLKEGDIFVQIGKNSKDRHVPISEPLISWLKKWAEARNPDAEYFFHTRSLKPLTPRQVQYICANASEKSGVYVQDGKEITPAHPHILRHCYCSNLLAKGIPIQEVQVLMGHENIQTTQIYTHVDMTELAKKIKALGKKEES
jgi:site-specific recombinase XerD